MTPERSKKIDDAFNRGDGLRLHAVFQRRAAHRRWALIWSIFGTVMVLLNLAFIYSYGTISLFAITCAVVSVVALIRDHTLAEEADAEFDEILDREAKP